MATEKLTDGYVEAIEKPDREIFVWDTALPRFGVRVTPAGARIYLVQYRAKAAPGEASKTRKITIGKHDGELWNVTKARAAARKLLAPVDLGADPFAVRQEALAAHTAARAALAEAEAATAREAEARLRDSVEAVVDRYIDLHLKETRSGHETGRLLRHGPVKAWSGRHIAEIRRSDVADLLDAIRKRSPATARLTYAALRSLFGWCIERDLLVSSPCDRLKAPPRPEARDRVLADDELKVIWAAAERLDYPFGPAIKLLMLTGQRRAEVGDMAWSEIDLEAAIWRIPKERTKNGQAHELDLSPQAVAILKSIPRSGSYVFPARKAKGSETLEPRGLRGFSAAKRGLDKLVEEARQRLDPKPDGPTPHWRLHDLRRTAATGMASMRFAPHIVERVLNHISGTQGGLVGVYQRFDYRSDRKAALVAWGARVEAIVTGQKLPSNVHELFA